MAGDQAQGMWDFDECSGTLAADRSGNGYNGTLTSSPTWSTDTPFGTGCSILFSGSNYVALANTASLDLGQTFTISAWIKPAAAATGWHDVWGGNTNDASFGFNSAGGGTMRFTKTNIIDAPVSTRAVTAGNWHHVAAVFSAGTLSYYVDGQSAGTFTFAQTFVPGVNRIGARVSSAGSFNGRIDAVRVFTKGLTAREVGELFAEEKALAISVARAD